MYYHNQTQSTASQKPQNNVKINPYIQQSEQSNYSNPSSSTANKKIKEGKHHASSSLADNKNLAHNSSYQSVKSTSHQRNKSQGKCAHAFLNECSFGYEDAAISLKLLAQNKREQ